MDKPKIISVLGPTSSGKSDFAVDLALAFNGEVISADSRQVYRFMNIGTGKITKEEMRGIPHYMLDITDPNEIFTVTEYVDMARKKISEILSRKKLPIVCGGTGLYADALLADESFPDIPPDAELRKYLESLGAEGMFKKLEDLDSARAASIDQHNPRRLVRALEIVIKSGKPVPERSKSSPYNILKIGLFWPKEELKKRIEIRLDARLDSGMIEEIRNIHEEHSVSWERLESFGLEYRYISRYLRGLIELPKARAELLKAIIDYSKRQMTWFKKDEDIHWLNPQDKESALPLAKDFLHG